MNMKEIFSYGNSIICMTSVETGKSFHVTILSRRAATLAIMKSAIGEWQSPIVQFIEEVEINELKLVGFSPITGYVVAVKS
jgi:hypothetical protein